MANENKRDYYERRKGDMKTERQSFISHYRDLSTNISPRRGRFETTDRNKGTPKHKSIINSVGTQALGTARAGMFAGVMSPTRPWFELATPDRELMKFMPVKLWLRTVAQKMQEVFNAGNLYVMAPVMISELLQFGTGCMTHVDDEDDIARFYTHTAGSYLISQNERYEVDTLVREFEMTAEQMVKRFGLENVSQPVKTAIDKGQLSSWFPVVQFIEPNDEFRPDSPLSKDKAFSSIHYEPGQNDKDLMLSRKGFDEFPAYVPRWGLTGEDIYGTDCPGMVTLGDIKGLQIQEKRKAQAIDKMVNPPLTGPASVRNVPVSSLPGGLTIYDGDSSRNKLESLYAVNINLADLREDMQRTEERIKNAFFVDLFLAISNMEGVQPRNELELSERNSERLLQLGPVLERMQGEFLDRLISRTFNQLIKSDELPEAPPEIQGSPLKVDYVSSLAQAQRSVATRSIDKLTQYTVGLMSAGLSDGKKFNGDKAIDAYAALVGTPPELVADDKDIAAQRAQEAQLAQMEQQIELAKGAGEAAASTGQSVQALAGADLSGDNPVASAVNNVNAQG